MANIFFSLLGDDTAGDGSILNPYRTFQKAHDVAVADDIIYGRGGTYNNKTTITRSGFSVAHSITAQPYQTEPVIFDGTGFANADNIYVASAAYWLIKGFELKLATRMGVLGDGSDHITLQNLISHDQVSCGYNFYNGCTNITLDTCIAHDTNSGGNQEAISLDGVNGFEVKKCLAYNVLANKEGIQIKHGCSNGSAHNNEVYNAKAGLNIDNSGVASSNIQLYANKLHNNTIIGMSLSSEVSPVNMSEIDIFNNLIYLNGTYGLADSIDAFQRIGIRIINNTLYGNGGNEITLVDLASYYQSCIIRNNILSHFGAIDHLLYIVNSLTGIGIDHNLFYNPAGYDPLDTLGLSYIQADPKFAYPTGNAFQPQATSPARGSGSPLLLPTYDYDGRLRIYPDIGAYAQTNNQALSHNLIGSL